MIQFVLAATANRTVRCETEEEQMKKADIGLVGLAVMGENLIMNMESKGFTVAAYNRTVEKVDAFVGGRAKGKNIIGTHSLEELAANLEKPLMLFGDRRLCGQFTRIARRVAGERVPLGRI